jgi:hypothetical protein
MPNRISIHRRCERGTCLYDIKPRPHQIAIEDSNYISKDTLLAERRKDLNNIVRLLPPRGTIDDQNRLGVKFKQTLLDDLPPC